MTKLLIPVGSLTGDPMGSRRFMVVDEGSRATTASESVLLNQDGTEYNPRR